MLDKEKILAWLKEKRDLTQSAENNENLNERTRFVSEGSSNAYKVIIHEIESGKFSKNRFSQYDNI